MNVMEIASGRGTNGALVHCIELSRELVRRGNHVTIVCLPDSWLYRRATSEGIFHVIPSTLNRWPPGELRRVAAMVRQRQIDLIHVHTSRANFFGILLHWMTGVPNVATAHARHVQLHWMFNARVIAVSEADRRYQRTHNLVRGRRIDTIHNFIDYRRIAGVPPETRHAVRAWLGVGKGDFLIGTIGKVSQRKGQIGLLHAMTKVLPAVQHARLAIVGGGTLGDYGIQARSEARRLGVASKTMWLGQRDDVPEILSAFDLYVLPSEEESFPLSILEAMAAGLPVVATAVGGVPECVVPDETGVLVPPGNRDALARAIIELAGDPKRRRRYGVAGRRRVVENFSPESQASAIETVFARTVRRRAAA